MSAELNQVGREVHIVEARRPSGSVSSGSADWSLNLFTVRRCPVEVTVAPKPVTERTDNLVTETYSTCVYRLEAGLYDFCMKNGMRVELEPSSPFSAGLAERILRRARIAQWLVSRFPVNKYTLYDSESSEPQCLVRIGRSLLGSARVKVSPYPGCTSVANEVARALNTSATASSGSLVERTPPMTPESSINLLLSTRSRLFSSLRNESSKDFAELIQETEQHNRGIALGLGPLATKQEIEGMNKLIELINETVRALKKGEVPEGDMSVVDGLPEFRKVYEIPRPERITRWDARLANTNKRLLVLGGMAIVADLVWLAATALATGEVVAPGTVEFKGPFNVTLPAVTSLGGICGLFISGVMRFMHDRRCQRYFNGAFDSQEPQSIGSIFRGFEDAGLGCSLKLLSDEPTRHDLAATTRVELRIFSRDGDPAS